MIKINHALALRAVKEIKSRSIRYYKSFKTFSLIEKRIKWICRDKITRINDHELAVLNVLWKRLIFSNIENQLVDWSVVIREIHRDMLDDDRFIGIFINEENKIETNL